LIKRVLEWARRKIFSTTFLKFGIVGASGVVVNYGIAYLGYIAGLSDIISLAIGVEAAIINNFTWNDLWIFRHRRTLKLPSEYYTSTPQGYSDSSPQWHPTTYSHTSSEYRSRFPISSR